MDAVLFLKEWKRMCKSKNCSNCILLTENNGCGTFSQNNPEKAVEIVEKWSRENPVKTMMDDFFEKFPNAPKNGRGEPTCCPHQCGYAEDNGCSPRTCVECWSRPLEVTK